MKFEDYEYVVKVEGKEFRTECNYGGLKDCQLFIQNNGKANKKYNIKMVKKEGK